MADSTPTRNDSLPPFTPALVAVVVLAFVALAGICAWYAMAGNWGRAVYPAFSFVLLAAFTIARTLPAKQKNDRPRNRVGR